MTKTDPWEGIETNPPISDFLSVRGSMGARMRKLDWSDNALGSPDQWPESLRSAVQMMLSSRQPICICWGPRLITLYNDSFSNFLGTKDDTALGTPFSDIWAEIWDNLVPFIRQALSGTGTWAEHLPLLMNRHGYDEQTFWTFSYSPLYGENDQVAGFINIASETTEYVNTQRDLQSSISQAQEHIAAQDTLERQRKLLNREMLHRSKNTLAMAMAIVSQTLRHSDSMQEASETISSRINALGRAQEMISQPGTDEGEIHEVMAAALAPHIDRNARISVEGPALTISAQQALGLSLAIHELATNAAKYGALSTAAGDVSVEWSLDGEQFRFIWREHGGPPVSPPKRQGFGTRLTGRMVAAYFNGKGQTSYDPTGIEYRLDGTLK